ncbi:hypothetical protein EYV94_27780 [Puteibacter caeruleilacunae]|nr:hypothetical protein EYV94_27780 [Puteibacter caeruleilacunae]
MFVTAESSFYVIDKSWINVRDLIVDHKLLSCDNNAVPIIATKKKDIELQLYDITVEGNHNYFVSKQKVLIHNK